jgi:hypothetical protein
MRYATIILLASLLAVPLIAQPRKEPWQLTLDERIALRTNPQLARERARRERETQPPSKLSVDARAAVIADSIDGKTHPELFLPHQVFDQLVKLAFLADVQTGEVVRKGFMPDVRRHGLPRDFWIRLESLSTIYFADFRAVTDLLETGRQQHTMADRERVQNALTLKHADACRSRAAAFAAARREFGRERFDRFLYEVIAVGMFSVTDRLPDPEVLRRAEEGCQ